MNKSIDDEQDPEKIFGATPYSTETRGVRIMVWPKYDDQRSRPAESVFFYEYFIKIVNHSSETVQLLSRHWIIRDGFDRTEEVKGEGVVGRQPILEPGQEFHYSSYCPLRTPTGAMSGSFQLRDKNNNVFDADISPFYLRNKMILN